MKFLPTLDTQQAEDLLLSLFKNNNTVKERKQLVTECLDHIELSLEERKDTSPGAPLNRAKCTIGSALAKLIRMGHLKQDENTVTLTRSLEVAKEAIKRDPIIRKMILHIVGEFRYKKDEILGKVVETYHQDISAEEKPSIIKADGGRILSDLLKSDEIRQKDGYYILLKNNSVAEAAAEVAVQSQTKDTDPLESLPSYVTTADTGEGSTVLQDSKNEEFPKLESSLEARAVAETAMQGGEEPPPKSSALMIKNRALFSRLSDEEFVNRSVELLEHWYRKRFPALLVKGANTDGPEDGGIDGNIVISDELWVLDRVVLQMKHINSPKKKHVPLCEVQEFCGALSADKAATKGAFITNAAYHAKTEQFAQSYTHKPFVLIDGEKWLALAESCEYALPDLES